MCTREGWKICARDSAVSSSEPSQRVKVAAAYGRVISNGGVGAELPNAAKQVITVKPKSLIFPLDITSIKRC